MHPNTICELATLRYHELQAHAAQQRRASEAAASRQREPGVMTTIRAWLGAMLIEIGTRLRGVAEAGTPANVFEHPERAAIS